jgi:hypothetical protein
MNNSRILVCSRLPMRRHHLSDRKKALVGGRPRALSPPGGAGGRKEKGGAALAEGREDGG